MVRTIMILIIEIVRSKLLKFLYTIVIDYLKENVRHRYSLKLSMAKKTRHIEIGGETVFPIYNFTKRNINKSYINCHKSFTHVYGDFELLVRFIFVR